jgi:hypothetical protein
MLRKGRCGLRRNRSRRRRVLRKLPPRAVELINSHIAVAHDPSCWWAVRCPPAPGSALRPLRRDSWPFTLPARSGGAGYDRSDCGALLKAAFSSRVAWHIAAPGSLHRPPRKTRRFVFLLPSISRRSLEALECEKKAAQTAGRLKNCGNINLIQTFKPSWTCPGRYKHLACRGEACSPAKTASASRTGSAALPNCRESS